MFKCELNYRTSDPVVAVELVHVALVGEGCICFAVSGADGIVLFGAECGAALGGAELRATWRRQRRECPASDHGRCNKQDSSRISSDPSARCNVIALPNKRTKWAYMLVSADSALPRPIYPLTKGVLALFSKHACAIVMPAFCNLKHDMLTRCQRRRYRYRGICTLMQKC